MTASEKKSIYMLLKTASDCINGFSSPYFPKEMPVFSDDKTNTKIDSISVNTRSTNNNPSENEADLKNSIENTSTTAELNSSASIESIAKKIAECSRCKLCSTRTNVVPGEGVKNPAVLVIGEGPGADEDESGRPFVGKAGQLLDKMLAAIQLDRTKNCFIANIVKCRPPNNRDPEAEEAEACSSFLQAQIAVLKPAMILCVGRIAAQNLLKTQTGINRLRGSFYDLNGIPVLCTYHPSALLRNADLKRPAWEDLKMFKAKLETIVSDYAAKF